MPILLNIIVSPTSTLAIRSALIIHFKVPTAASYKYRFLHFSTAKVLQRQQTATLLLDKLGVQLPGTRSTTVVYNTTAFYILPSSILSLSTAHHLIVQNTL